MMGCASFKLGLLDGQTLNDPQLLKQFYLRTLRETLDAVVTPRVRDELIAAALSRASLSHTPSSPAEFAAFLTGPLRLAMSDALGLELSDTLLAELEQLVRPSFRPGVPASSSRVEQSRSQPIGAVALKKSRASSSAAPRCGPVSGQGVGRLPAMRAPSPVPTKPASSVPASSPVSHSYPNGMAETLGLEGSGAPSSSLPARIFLATRRDEFQTKFERFLSGTAGVVRIDDVLDLVRRLEDQREPSVLIVDCKHSSLRPIALAALADDLPHQVRVILWGASTSLRTQIAQLAPEAESWLIVDGEDSDLQTLARRCEQVG
jgi:hypothetical protein